MKIVTLLLNILCLKFCLSISNRSNNELQMIVDVITSYDRPSAVVGKVCWKSHIKLKLATMLASQRSMNIRYQENTKLEDARDSAFSNHLIFLIDLNYPAIKYFFFKASANRMFSKTYRWLILGKTDAFMKEYANLDVLVDSEFIIAEQKNEDFILKTVYKINPEREWIVEHFATWDAINGLNKSEDRLISNAMRRKDLRGNPLSASLVISDNRTKHDYNNLNDFAIDAVTKSTYQTINNLYEFLNATQVIIFSDTWGYPVNGSWSGIIGDIYNGKAELCGSFTFINKERLHILEYIIVPASISTIKIVFRQPPLSYQHNLFVLPFTTNVWYCLAGFIFIITIILYINVKWDIKKQEQYEEKPVDQTCLSPDWSDVIIFVLSAISQQGSSNELKGSLGRLVMFLVFLAFVFLYTSYSASIVVLLQSTSDQIRTVTDLMNSKLELGIEDVVYNKFYFSERYAKDPLRKAFYNTKIAPRGSKPNYLSLEEGVKRLQTKPFAFNMNLGIGYRIISQYFQEHEKCGLREIDYIQASKPWLCSKKNSPFTEMYKVGIFRVEEHGLSDRNNRRIFAKKPLCTVTGGNFGSVNMLDFYPVLLVLVYGTLLALALFVLEILVHRRQKMKANAVEIED